MEMFLGNGIAGIKRDSSDNISVTEATKHCLDTVRFVFLSNILFSFSNLFYNSTHLKLSKFPGLLLMLIREQLHYQTMCNC